MNEKEYKITFTTDYSEYQPQHSRAHYAPSKRSEICRKYKGKTIKLSEIPAFVAEVGECIISNDEIEIYNDYRE